MPQAQKRKKTWVQLQDLIQNTAVPGIANNFAITFTPPNNGEGSREALVAVTGDGTGAAPLVSSLPEESTILRIRGSLSFPKSVRSDPGQAGDQCNSIGFGVVGVADLDANSYPAPISDAGWDGWMFKRESSISPLDPQGAIVDVKAMRKIKTGEAFMVMAEAVAFSTGATPATWQFDLRLLLLLP